MKNWRESFKANHVAYQTQNQLLFDTQMKPALFKKLMSTGEAFFPSLPEATQTLYSSLHYMTERFLSEP